MNDIITIVKSLEESGILIKGAREKIKKQSKGTKTGLLGMLLGKLGASLSGNLWIGKGAIATSQGHKVNMLGRGIIGSDEGIFRADESTIRPGQTFRRRPIL